GAILHFPGRGHMGPAPVRRRPGGREISVSMGMSVHRGRKWWVTAGLTAAVAGLAAGSFAAQAAGADREDVSDLHFLALSALVLLVGMLVASRDGRMR